jgi:hypothetical protein
MRQEAARAGKTLVADGNERDEKDGEHHGKEPP